MDRLEMLGAAESEAHEAVGANCALGDKHYGELRELPHEDAINKLAKEILQEALDNYDFMHEEE